MNRIWPGWFFLVLLCAVCLAQQAPAPASPSNSSNPRNSSPESSTTRPPCPANGTSAASKTPCAPVHKKAKSKPHPSDGKSAPPKKIVQNGGEADSSVELSVGTSQQQVEQQLNTTNNLLTMTDENLKIIEARQLTASQQDTVTQIKSYMEQSKAAANSGDSQRAYTLANKARMLSGDLVKH